jgi:small subunit ribosomal protein S8
MTDPISDFFIRIKNAQNAGHETAQMPYSRMKHEIAKTLERGGFIARAERKGKRVKKILEVALIGGRENPRVHGVRLVSTPGKRVYSSCKDLRLAERGGMMIVTTSKGIFSAKEARQQRVGGQVIAEIW